MTVLLWTGRFCWPPFSTLEFHFAHILQYWYFYNEFGTIYTGWYQVLAEFSFNWPRWLNIRQVGSLYFTRFPVHSWVIVVFTSQRHVALEGLNSGISPCCCLPSWVTAQLLYNTFSCDSTAPRNIPLFHFIALLVSLYVLFCSQFCYMCLWCYSHKWFYSVRLVYSQYPLVLKEQQFAFVQPRSLL